MDGIHITGTIVDARCTCKYRENDLEKEREGMSSVEVHLNKCLHCGVQRGEPLGHLNSYVTVNSVLV